MASKDIKSNNKPKLNYNKKKRRKRKTKKELLKEKKSHYRLLKIAAVSTAVILLVSTYAWLSASLNVRIKFFDLSVSSNNGLFISLDGIKFSDTVEISSNTVIKDLKSTYQSNTNQWSSGGLWPVSSNGIRTINSNKFDVFVGSVAKEKTKNKFKRKFLSTELSDEGKSNESNVYIAFDIFLKNVSGSPKSDNLFLDKDTYVDFDPDKVVDLDEEELDSMKGILNSIRFGFVKMSTVSSKSNTNTIQSIGCNNNCEMVIYEPNSTVHSNISILRAQDLGIELINGVYNPTYAVINGGRFLNYANGQVGSNLPLDEAHFRMQNTTVSFENPIFTIPNGITKFRVYVWIEGQDMDSLETNSAGAPIYLAINFVKDLAGYE